MSIHSNHFKAYLATSTATFLLFGFIFSSSGFPSYQVVSTFNQGPAGPGVNPPNLKPSMATRWETTSPRLYPENRLGSIGQIGAQGQFTIQADFLSTRVDVPSRRLGVMREDFQGSGSDLADPDRSAVEVRTLQGATGLNGVDSTLGQPGALGATGLTGAAGPQGRIGLSGAAGAVGSTGNTGPQGLIGASGAAGVRGSAGAAGSTGAAGAVGSAGAAGPQGLIGASGAAGVRGTAGAAGSTGAAGAVGSAGAAGPTGQTGSIGPQGNTGATGAIGLTGSLGPQGSAGGTGDNGKDGTDGTNGKDGTDGTNGKDGTDGTDGTDGKDGTDGTAASIATYTSGFIGCAFADRSNPTTAFYVKSGDLVFFHITVAFKTEPTCEAGPYQVLLPYTPGSNFVFRDAYIFDLGSSDERNAVSAYAVPTTKWVDLYYLTNYKDDPLKDTSPVKFAEGDFIYISGTYTVGGGTK